MKYVYILILGVLSYYRAASQVKVVDSQTKEPIPYAHIVASDGSLLGTSNEKGYFSKDVVLIKEYSEKDTLVIQHISFKNFSIAAVDFSNSEELMMTPQRYALKEIVVSNKQPEYLVLKGYFRSYQFDDSVARYFTDGIVEYVIKLNGSNRLTFNLMECRSYRNEEIEKREKKRAVTMTIAGIPYIEAKAGLLAMGKKYSEDGDSAAIRILKQNKEVGSIRVKRNARRIYLDVDMVAPEQEKVNSLFNYTSLIKSMLINEVYQGLSVGDISKANLLGRKEYRKILFKHKKDKMFTSIDTIHEFYATEFRYSSKDDLKQMKQKSFFGLYKSSYSSALDLFIKDNHIPPINENIASHFDRELTLYQ